MKARKWNALLAIFFLFTSVVAFGQNKQRQGKRMMHGLELTEAQKTKMKEIRQANESEMVQWKSEQKVLQAELKALQVKPSPSQNEINRKIDQLSALQVKMMKQRAENHQKIRTILTPEQRATFDKRFLEGKREKKMRKRVHKRRKQLKEKQTAE